MKNLIDYQKLNKEELYWLNTIFNLYNFSIYISKSYTNIRNNNFNINGKTGILINIVFNKLCNKDVKQSLELLQKLQDNRNDEVNKFNNYIKINNIDFSDININTKNKNIKNNHINNYEVQSYDFTIDEIKKALKMTYLEYCKYLQNKYGVSNYNYFYPSFKKNQNVTRTKEGLICHHIMENKVAMLSHEKVAKYWPYEWQESKNLVYCNFLEHLLLHILICIYPEAEKGQRVGIGGIINFIVPELNDIYSGYLSKQEWKQNIYKLILDKEDLYFVLIKIIIDMFNLNKEQANKCLCNSLACSGRFSILSDWNEANNKKIYDIILSLTKK